MTLLVPFDGSELAEAALVRAAEFGTVFEEPVLAVSVVPEGNTEYARERDWLGPDEAFDAETVAARLREQVQETAPETEFRHIAVGRYASTGTIAGRVRDVASEVDASVVFIGSENAGGMVVGVSSVGGSIASDEGYDVFIVRHQRPPKLAELRRSSP